MPDFGVRPATLAGASQCSDLALLKIADGETYVVPLNFGYRDGKAYFHSFSTGHKIDAIVIGFGHARMLEDPYEKVAGLTAIMNHLGDQEPVFREFDMDRVAGVETEFDRLTGKQSLQ